MTHGTLPVFLYPHRTRYQVLSNRRIPPVHPSVALTLSASSLMNFSRYPYRKLKHTHYPYYHYIPLFFSCHFYMPLDHVRRFIFHSFSTILTNCRTLSGVVLIFSTTYPADGCHTCASLECSQHLSLSLCFGFLSL